MAPPKVISCRRFQVVEIDGMSFTLAKLPADDVRATDEELKALRARLSEKGASLKAKGSERPETEPSDPETEALVMDIGVSIEEVRHAQRQACETSLSLAGATDPKLVGKLDIDQARALFREVMEFSGTAAREGEAVSP